MKRSVLNLNFKRSMLSVAAVILSLATFAQSGSSGNSGSGSSSNSTMKAPELVFLNPQLVSGTANKEGAVYRFANVTSGVDAELKLKKFSRKDIVMEAVDLSGLGWEKALQPKFGLPGLVQPYQNWYIDFEMNFFQAGTNKKVRMQKVDMTALDVDGDGYSISEYVNMDQPNSVSYSTVSYLLGKQPTSGAIGQTFECDDCGVSSTLMTCTKCLGTGKILLWDCDDCDGSGKLYSACRHAYQVPSVVEGPVENFTNIDTAATQVMATYTYLDKDKIKFRYGAKSAAGASNGSGIRLNSLWYRQFSLAPATTLPVKLSNFTASTENKNVTLSWTGYEENFSHYILQRSTDGKEYNDVALIFAENNPVAANYKYKDANVSSASNAIFYRLKLVDKVKEAIKYSEVRVVRLVEENQVAQILTYPNPVVGDLKITLPSAWQGKEVTFELYSANGVKMVQSKVASANQTETMQVAKVAKGFYVVKAICSTESLQQRIVKN